MRENTGACLAKLKEGRQARIYQNTESLLLDILCKSVLIIWTKPFREIQVIVVGTEGKIYHFGTDIL